MLGSVFAHNISVRTKPCQGVMVESDDLISCESVEIRGTFVERQRKKIGSFCETLVSIMECPMPHEATVIKPQNVKWKYYTVALLLVINLLNYIDRYTMSPLLQKIEDFYGVGDAWAGTLQTIFICVYMVFAPIFGHLGDKYSRKILISVGVTIWSVSVILGTLIPRNAFWAFVLFRGLVGIGEASYSTVAPTIIADFYAGDARSRVLIIFYIAIPVGAGIGNALGGTLADALGAWQWGLRITPIIGFVTAILFLFSYDPPRGMSEDRVDQVQHTEKKAGFKGAVDNIVLEVKEIMTVPTFNFITFGFAATTFAIGAISFWGASYLRWAYITAGRNVSDGKAGLIFGVITAVGGIAGTTIGSLVAQCWRRRDKKADCLVCALSLMFGSCFLFAGLTMAADQIEASMAIVFIAVVLLCFNWAINPDIVLYVMPPKRRALATGITTLVSHVLGDATSPVIIGAISDSIRGANHGSVARYYAFRSAFYLGPYVCVIGAAFYFIASFYVVGDVGKQEAATTPSSDSHRLSEDFNTKGSINAAYIPEKTLPGLPEKF